jgi:long-chain acyl-CoA synthetase
MQGYRNNLAATNNVIDEEGWYNSGDVVLVDEDGYVQIVDRFKEIIKMADGCNVSGLYDVFDDNVHQGSR